MKIPPRRASLAAGVVLVAAGVLVSLGPVPAIASDATPSPTPPAVDAAPQIVTSPGAVLGLTEDVPEALEGDPASFDVTVTNTGTASTPVVVTEDWNDQLGGGDAWIDDVTATGPHADGCGFNELAGVANCSLGVVAPGDSASVTITGVGVDLDGAENASNSFTTYVNDKVMEFGGWGIGRLRPGLPTGTVDRISGDDRYSTAVALARSAYPSAAPVVFVATGTSFPDALSAGPAAAHEGGPLLLTDPNSLPSSVADELTSLAPSRVVIVGGTTAVSADVAAEIAAAVPRARVDRLAGTDRYDTNRRVIADAYPDGLDGKNIWVATGTNYPDALSAAAAAGTGSALLLVPGDASGLDAATTSALAALHPTGAAIAGGLAAVSNGIQSDLEARYGHDRVARYGGADRYVTSHLIGNTFVVSGYSIGRVYIATGTDYPDALAASAVAGAAGKPLLLAQQSCVPDSVLATVNDGYPSAITLVGGTSALSDAAAAFASC